MRACFLFLCLSVIGVSLLKGDESIGHFLDQHCIECHDGDVQKGDVNLEPLFEAMGDLTNPKDALLWHDVMDQLNLDEMPPKKEEQPADAEILATVEWISDKLEAFHTRGGTGEEKTLLRRMNKVEYRNTVNDILGIDFEPGEDFPADGTTEGFDNIARGLFLSTALFEKYLNAAETITSKAIVPGKQPERINRRCDGKLIDCELGIRRDKGFEIASNREARARVFPVEPVPFDGTYRVRFSVTPVRSKGKPLGVKLKTGLPDRELTVSLKQVEEFSLTRESEFETFVDVKEGDTVHVSFVNGGGIPTVGAQKKYKGAAVIINWIEVDGPIIDQWPPESDRKLLAPAGGKFDLEGAKMVLRAFAYRAYRRPPSEAMLKPLIETFQAERSAGRYFREAIQSAMQVALCSPRFLYLNIPSEDSESPRLNDYELATRLSYFIWSSTPDQQLLRIAGENGLSDPKVLNGELDRMLKDPKANQFYSNFVGQWLSTRRVGDMQPDPKLFPQWDDELEEAVRGETERFIKHLVANDLSIFHVIDSDFTMLNERLARHYGIDGVKGEQFRKVALLPKHRRGGVIGQASFLTVTSNGTNTSPVIRGIYVLERILGTPPAPPPPDVDPIEPDTRGTTTIREQLKKHRESATCFDCHQEIDPLGLVLESYDPIGRWRDHYRGVGKKKKGPVVENTAETADGIPLNGPDGLKDYLMERKHLVARGLVEKLLLYATGRELSFMDEKSVHAIAEKTVADDRESGFRTVLSEVIRSEAFGKR